MIRTKLKTHCKRGHEYTTETTLIKKQSGKGREGQTQRCCKICHAEDTYFKRHGHAKPQPNNEREKWEHILSQHNLSLNRGLHHVERKPTVVYFADLRDWGIGRKPFDNPWHEVLSDGFVVMQLTT